MCLSLRIIHSGKEKVFDATVCKEGHADIHLAHKMIHYNLFPLKSCNCKQCQLLRKNSFDLLNDPRIYIYIYMLGRFPSLFRRTCLFLFKLLFNSKLYRILYLEGEMISPLSLE